MLQSWVRFSSKEPGSLELLAVLREHLEVAVMRVLEKCEGAAAFDGYEVEVFEIALTLCTSREECGFVCAPAGGRGG